MAVAFSNVFSRQNLNLAVGLLTLLVVLWGVMFAIPDIFVKLFDTSLGNLLLLCFIILAALYNPNLAIGLAIVFTILYRFSHMKIEQFIL